MKDIEWKQKSGINCGEALGTEQGTRVDHLVVKEGPKEAGKPRGSLW